MPTFPLATRSQHQRSDGRYPIVASTGSVCPVVLDAADGDVRRAAMRSLSIQAQHKGHVRDTTLQRRGAGDLIVTDARVILAGSRPTPDSLVTGHVLLDWIVAVGGCSAGGRLRGDALRLVLQLDNGEYHVVTITFHHDVDVHELAQDIARRTARRWLAEQGSSPLASRWSELAGAERLSAPAGEFALHFTPSHSRVTAPAGALDRMGIPA